MSPRGVAIPDLRERLFHAAERVLAREGPAALTSRAITTEAGCAKGVLHTHFDGLDSFVAELVLDRFARTSRQAEQIPAQAGHATVADNLLTVALTLLESPHPTIVGLAMTHPGASSHIRQELAAGAPGFTSIQDAITEYLDAEQRLGRIADDTDTHTISLALVGTLHHLLMTSWAGTSDTHEQVKRLVALLLDTRPAGAAAGAENLS